MAFFLPYYSLPSIKLLSKDKYSDLMKKDRTPLTPFAQSIVPYFLLIQITSGDILTVGRE